MALLYQNTWVYVYPVCCEQTESAMQRVGLITIGQSPREDIVASMFDRSASFACIEHGALDDLNQAQIEQLAPQDDELPLVSRLRDGTEVLIAKERIIPLLQRAVERAAQD